MIQKRCPSCGGSEWYADYHRTADGELRVDHCKRCDWPPDSIMGPAEWRAHPDNPLNEAPNTEGGRTVADISSVDAVRESADYEPVMIAEERFLRELVMQLREERDFLRAALKLALAPNTDSGRD